MRLYCENCDQCFNGPGDPRSTRDHRCTDCMEKLVVAEHFLRGERQTLWEGHHDEDHD